jgi:hypothetical protein
MVEGMKNMAFFQTFSLGYLGPMRFESFLRVLETRSLMTVSDFRH